MPKSRNQPKSLQGGRQRRHRFDWRRVAGGIAEFCRNVALITFGTPFIEPSLSGGAINLPLVFGGALLGVAFIVLSLIFDHERSD
jgi:hypothetical protein